MDNSYFYKADEVRSLAKGQWLFILAHLMPELEPALKKAGKSHVTCPFHGGKKTSVCSKMLTKQVVLFVLAVLGMMALSY